MKGDIFDSVVGNKDRLHFFPAHLLHELGSFGVKAPVEKHVGLGASDFVDHR
jgi:hypothetical protein